MLTCTKYVCCSNIFARRGFQGMSPVKPASNVFNGKKSLVPGCNTLAVASVILLQKFLSVRNFLTLKKQDNHHMLHRNVLQEIRSYNFTPERNHFRYGDSKTCSGFRGARRSPRRFDPCRPNGSPFLLP